MRKERLKRILVYLLIACILAGVLLPLTAYADDDHPWNGEITELICVGGWQMGELGSAIAQQFSGVDYDQHQWITGDYTADTCENVTPHVKAAVDNYVSAHGTGEGLAMILWFGSSRSFSKPGWWVNYSGTIEWPKDDPNEFEDSDSPNVVGISGDEIFDIVSYYHREPIYEETVVATADEVSAAMEQAEEDAAAEMYPTPGEDGGDGGRADHEDQAQAEVDEHGRDDRTQRDEGPPDEHADAHGDRHLYLADVARHPGDERGRPKAVDIGRTKLADTPIEGVADIGAHALRHGGRKALADEGEGIAHHGEAQEQRAHAHDVAHVAARHTHIDHAGDDHGCQQIKDDLDHLAGHAHDRLASVRWQKASQKLPHGYSPSRSESSNHSVSSASTSRSASAISACFASNAW